MRPAAVPGPKPRRARKGRTAAAGAATLPALPGPEADAAAEPVARLPLRFGGGRIAATGGSDATDDGAREAVTGEDHPAQDLSALAFADGALWTAADELAVLERFARQDDGGFGDLRRFAMRDYLADLPDPDPDAEMDIEGVDVDGDWLWVVGSHSLRRLRPDPDRESDPAELIERLGRVDRQDNRYTLARLPLVKDDAGLPAPVRATDEDPPRRAAHLPFTHRGNRLAKALRHDDHLAPFIGVPAKENGFDIEGLAARGERVFLGLRGPVLRGYAVVLELRVAQKGGRLRLRHVDEGDERYRKHFLDLRGLGVRDLALDGDDLLVLAGPTLAHDGRHAVFRWRDALKADGPTLLRRPEPRHLLDLRLVPDSDRAEGIALHPTPDGGPGLLVVHDSPSHARLTEVPGALLLDLFALPAG